MYEIKSFLLLDTDKADAEVNEWLKSNDIEIITTNLSPKNSVDGASVFVITYKKIIDNTPYRMRNKE